jgi:hypothetical protein
LSESESNETWATNLTNWISPQFGAGYQVKLYAGPSGATGSTPLNYINLPVGGSGNADSWYFDYSAGIVNFADTNVPTAVAGNVVYVVGARYTGSTGIAVLPNVTVTGTIFANVITANAYLGNIGGNVTGNVSGNISGNIGSFGNIYGNLLTPYQPYITSVGSLSNLHVVGNTTVSNVIASGSYFGNIIADTITPYQTNVVVFTNNTAIQIPSGPSAARPQYTAGYIRYNTDSGTPEYANGTEWIPIGGQVMDQQITPDGVNTVFALMQGATASGVIVSINGTIQTPGVAYSISGQQITFAEVPGVTDLVDIRYLTTVGTAILDYTLVDTAYIVGTNPYILDSFGNTAFRSAKYIISSTNPYDSTMAEVMLLQNNGQVFINSFGILNTGGNTLNFSANMTGSTVNFIVTGTTASNQLKVQRTYFEI